MQRGTRLGSYALVEQLGAGGMGVVWRATDSRLGRDVAVKILPPHLAQHAESLARFEREARGLAAISHPNIVAIHDVGHAEGLHYLVTELLNGETLRSRLRYGPLPWRAAAEICASVADGLSAAHAKGIIHRDLKPENIFVTDDERLKVLDFGIAKDIVMGNEDATTEELRTEPGRVLGTIGYMSPEQLRGEALAPTSDIFSLGCVFHEMLSARSPFLRATSVDTIAAILTQDPPTIDWPSDVPLELRSILERCLAKQPSSRFQSARDLAGALRTQLTLPRPAELPSTNIPGWSIAAVAIAALAGLASAWLYQRGSLVARSSPTPVIAPAPAAITLALVPFETDESNAYASEGFVEGLFRNLASLDRLRIITPRSPSFDGSESMQTLRGTIRGASSALTVAAELVEGPDRRVVWRRQYSSAGNLNAVERQLANDVAVQLHLEPDESTTAERRPASKFYEPDPEAYREYLKGRHHWNKFTPAGREKALDHYQRAIDIDPTYALAYCGLADTYTMMGFYGERPEETLPKGRAAAQRAIEVDPHLGEAYTSLGTTLYLYDWNWTDAEAALRRGVELNPRYATAHHSLGTFLGFLGRLDEARREIETAIEIDPLSVVIRIDHAWVLYLQHDKARAIEALRAALRQDPRSPLAWGELSWHLEHDGRVEEAIDAYAKAYEFTGEDPAALEPLREAYRTGGERAFLELRLKLQTASGDYAVNLARTKLRLGDRDGALDLLEESFRRRERLFIYVAVSPVWDALRGEPRFESLVAGLGLPNRDGKLR